MDADVKTAVRTLDAFEAFARSQGPLSLSELARAIGAPLSSCHGLVATLRNHGYLYAVGDSRDVYPTRRILDVAEAIVRNDPLLEIVAPALTRLRDDTGETVILGTREGDGVIYLDVFEGMHTIRYSAKPGEIKPLYSSAIGKAMLASLDERALAKAMARLKLDRITPATLTDEDALRRDLENGRAKGVFITRGENVADVMGMAALARPGGQTVAVALAGPLERMERALDSHSQRLRHAVQELSGLEAA
ncbi:MAG: IclR family transcriptional regulator [Rhodospirillales bacterium CG15_BIG_FIL_POST_REV_8_21_14_020_66_15]|nr:MAG: IclR family transcriptional regulator [Rhodospirillales bacterium CG15_BIG_FIL_POST_REV_8_21_14_020_66_15]